jgi:hypothetical protein
LFFPCRKSTSEREGRAIKKRFRKKRFNGSRFSGSNAFHAETQRRGEEKSIKKGLRGSERRCSGDRGQSF